MNNKILKEYLNHVFMIERRVYELSKIKDDLNSKLQYFNRTSDKIQQATDQENWTNVMALSILDDAVYQQEVKMIPNKISKYIKKLIFLILGMGFLVGLIFIHQQITSDFTVHQDSLTSSFDMLMKNVVLFSVRGLIILFLIIEFSGSISLIKQYLGNKKFNTEAKKKNAEIRKYNDNQYSINEGKREIFKEELLLVQKKLRETIEIRDKLYSFNIVYKDYRGLVPIASIFQYIDSGRCSTLEGRDGAYNLYENEMRSGVVISLLNDIVASLDSIRNNQQLLYNTIQESNQLSQKIVSLLNDNNNILKSIKENSEVMRYNSDISRANLETLKWMNILNG